VTQSTDKPEQLYHMRYSIKPEPEGVPKEAAQADEGLCDSIIVHSIVEPEDGSLSHMVLSSDGRKSAPISLNQQFHIWSIWAHSLMSEGGLSDNRRQICAFVHETVKAAVLAARMADDEENKDA